MLAREPIRQMISYVSHYFSRVRTNLSLDSWIYEYISDHYNTGYKDILDQCTIFANTFETSSNTNDNMINNNNNNNNNDWSTMEYRKFIIKYLYQARVVDTIFAQEYKNRRQSIFESTVIFPALLMFVYNYDEKFGYSNWNQFRLVQFEWLYSQHMNHGLSMIKCWLQTDRTPTASDNYNGFHDCPQIFYNDRQYFNNISNLLTSKIGARANSRAIEDDVNQEYKQFFIDFFQPCNRALVSLIQHRPEILLGEWVYWEY